MQEVLLQFLEWEKGTSTVHPDFRLWITTEVHDAFPISLLQICIKFTNEAPSGIVMSLIYFSNGSRNTISKPRTRDSQLCNARILLDNLC